MYALRIQELTSLPILALLYTVERTDFSRYSAHIGLSEGNLSSRVRRMDKEGYVKVEKADQGYPFLHEKECYRLRISRSKARARRENRAGIGRDTLDNPECRIPSG
jgi:hypothetical protein